MVDVLLALTGALFIFTVGAAIEYYRVLRKVHREYIKAKEAVEMIVLSFNRQLNRESEKLETLAVKVEALSSKSDRTANELESVEKKVQFVEGKLEPFLGGERELLTKIEEMDKKVRDVTASHEMLTTKISVIEGRLSQILEAPEARVEAAIPIKREKVLAPLTETEVAVLKMLALEGPKTAPEIKERIRLSREHTARLMKKLYEGGYLERDTQKIPFKYSVKKEMEEILRKAETEEAS
jgi:chromosome segregation ATPase